MPTAPTDADDEQIQEIAEAALDCEDSEKAAFIAGVVMDRDIRESDRSVDEWLDEIEREYEVFDKEWEERQVENLREEMSVEA